MTTTDHRPATNQRRLIAVLVVLFLLGVISMTLAFGLGKPLVVGEVLWDLGLGLGVATAISLVLSLYLQRIEDQEQRRIADDARARAEENEQREVRQRIQDQRFAQLNEDLDKLSKNADAIASQIQIAGLEADHGRIEALVGSVQGELRNFRSAMDRSYTHPDQALVEEILDRMAEKLEPGRPKSGPTD